MELWVLVHQKDPERTREPSLVASLGVEVPSGSLEVEKQESGPGVRGRRPS